MQKMLNEIDSETQGVGLIKCSICEPNASENSMLCVHNFDLVHTCDSSARSWWLLISLVGVYVACCMTVL